MENCPCGSNKAYSVCCGVFISGQKVAPTPEALMRSRYTAYTKANVDYIEKTMRGPAMKHFDKKEAAAWAKEAHWLGLQVLGSTQKDKSGTVEFIASYSVAGQNQSMRELSQFELDNEQWYYVDGAEKPSKVGRNELCSCGSQKKFKKCCGK